MSSFPKICIFFLRVECTKPKPKIQEDASSKANYENGADGLHTFVIGSDGTGRRTYLCVLWKLLARWFQNLLYCCEGPTTLTGCAEAQGTSGDSERHMPGWCDFLH